MSTDIIDLKDVLERVQDDKELLLELLDIYQEDFLVKRKSLGEAVAANDTIKIKEIAHSMKGSSGNISAKPLYASCLQLEMLVKAQSTDGMNDLLTVIDQQFEQVKAYAVKLKKDFSAA